MRYSEIGEAMNGMTNDYDIVDLVATPPAPPSETVSPDISLLPHEAVIQGVLQGHTAQYKDDDGVWHDLRSKAYALRYILQNEAVEMRIKPVTDTVWMPVYKNGRIGESVNRREDVADEGWGVKHVLRVVRERDTLRVLSFEHEEPAPKGSKVPRL